MRLMQLKRFGRGFVVAAAAATMSAGVGCKKDTDVAAEPAAADVAVAAPKTPEAPIAPVAGDEVARPRQGLDAPAVAVAPSGIFASPTLRLAPASTRIAVVANFATLFKWAGPQAAAGALSLDGMFGSMLGAAKKELELDILEPASFARAGIAMERDFSFAWLSDDDDAFMLGFELTDVAAFTAWFERIIKSNGRTLAKEVLADATILTVEGKQTGAILVTETTAWLFGMGHGGDTPALARRIHAGGGGLAGHSEFAGTVGRIPAAAAGVYVSKEQLGVLATPHSETWMKRAERELKVAKESNDAEAVAAAERELGFAKESMQWEHPSVAGVQKLLEPATGLAFGLNIGEREIVLSAFLGLSDGAQLRKIVVPGGRLAIEKLVGANTLFAYGSRISPRDYLSMMLGMAGLEAEVMSELKSSLARFLQIDLEADVLGQLTGEVGAVVSGDAASLADGGNPFAALDGTAVIGIRDGAKVSTLLEKLPGLEVMQGSGASWDSAALRLNLPVPGAVIYIAAADGALVATNRPANLERLKSNDAGGLAALVPAGVVKDALSSPQLAGFVGFSAAMLEPMIASSLTMSLEFGLWPPAPIDDDASEADKKAFAALNEAYEAARTERRAAIDAAHASVRKVLVGLGTGVQTLEAVDGGLKLHFGQFMPATTTLGAWLGEAMGLMSPGALSSIEEGPAQKKYEAMRRGDGGEGAEDAVRPDAGGND